MGKIVFILAIFIMAGNTFAKVWHVNLSTANGGGNATNGRTWDADSVLSRDTVKKVWNTGGYTAGDIFAIKGSMVAQSAGWVMTVAGTTANPNMLIGVKASCTDTGINIDSTDWETDSAGKPFIDLATFRFTLPDSTIVKYVRMQGDTLNMVVFGKGCYVSGCWFNNDYTYNNSRNLLTLGSNCLFENNEISSQYTNGVVASSGSEIKNCLFRDFTYTSSSALSLPTTGVSENNVFYNCAGNGIIVAGNAAKINMCNFDSMGTAISIGTSKLTTVWNCLIIHSVNGISQTNAWASSRFHNNDMYDVDNEYVNASTSPFFSDWKHGTYDPLFTTRLKNYTLQAGSPAKNTGSGNTLGAK